MISMQTDNVKTPNSYVNRGNAVRHSALHKGQTAFETSDAEEGRLGGPKTPLTNTQSCMCFRMATQAT